LGWPRSCHSQISIGQRLEANRCKPGLIKLVKKPANRASIRRTITPRSRTVAGQEIEARIAPFRDRSRLDTTRALARLLFRSTQTLPAAICVSQNLLQDRPVTSIYADRDRSRSPSHIRQQNQQKDEIRSSVNSLHI